MKRIALVAALAVISACSQSAEAPEAEATTETTAEAVPAEVMAADGGPAYGKFKITQADGTSFTDDVRPDGTYTSTAADGTVMQSGTWVQKPGEYCTTKDEEGAVEECYPEKIDDKGVWISSNTKTGETVMVERLPE
ncbi:hypothetical protein [Erythrobacter mangrovi]|uniref:Lipoprotein n=1 Tax=Erythrobacter mangrovi TaxID=2739433 RepID=A0A7D4CBQ0_9SPHN|nr:hypothetical protein [Erythrobacter mangrovi]QKG70109.1 hypothetical protein HQR01_01285 [Erythrobacter mangrovi]